MISNKTKKFFLACIAAVAMVSCIETEEQRLAREKALQDSLQADSMRLEDKAFEDSLVNVARTPQQEKIDSTDAPLDGSADPNVK